jgi:hypothetical protein
MYPLQKSKAATTKSLCKTLTAATVIISPILISPDLSIKNHVK